MKKTALLLMIITILSKLIGFGREMVLAYFYGASNISDAYIISMTIPTVIFAFIGNGISTAYIPLYTRLENKQGTNRANEYTTKLINIIMIICVALVGVGLIFTEEIIQIFANGFEGHTLQLATEYTKISLFGIFFTALISIFNSFLQIKGNYLIPALIGLPLNLIVVISIIISAQGNTTILAYGILISTIAQFLFLLPWIKKGGFKYNFVVDLSDPEIKSMLFLALPVIMGVAVNDINKIVDRSLASQIAVGGISALNYAQKLNGFVQGIIVTSIGTAMYPLISKLAIENNMKGLKKVINESVIGTSIFVIPCMMGTMFLSQPIIEVLFGRGQFDHNAIKMTSDALFFYALGMVAIGLRNILSRPFYSLQDTKTPMINASIGVVINIILNFILAPVLGVGGLALATSISAICTTILMCISLYKKIGSFGIMDMIVSFIKILLAAIFMGYIVRICFNSISKISNQEISLMLSIMIGISIYFVTIYYIKIKEIDAILKVIKNKFLSYKVL